MATLDQIADKAAKAMADGLLTQDDKIRKEMNRVNEHYVVFNQALYETINVTASMTELVQILPDLFDKFATARDKFAVELESKSPPVKMTDNPPTSAQVVKRAMNQINIYAGDIEFAKPGATENIYGRPGGRIIRKSTGKDAIDSYTRLRQKMNNLSVDLQNFTPKGGVEQGKQLGHQNVTAVTQRMTAVLVNLIDLKGAIIQANPNVKRERALQVNVGSDESQKQFQQAGIKTIKDIDNIISKVSKLIGIFEILQDMPQQKLSKQKYGGKNLNALTKEFKRKKKILGAGFNLKATKQKNINIFKRTDKLIELKMESPEYNRDYKGAAETSIAVEFRKILKNRDDNINKVNKLFRTIKHEDIEGSPSIKQKIRGDLKKLAKGKKVTPHKSTSTSKNVRVKSKAKINLTAVSQTPAITKKLAKEATRLKAAVSRGKATKAGAKKPKTGRDQLNLAKIQAAINTRLPAEVRRNMGRPALINQTGRFSNSVKLTGLRQAPNSIVADYTYQLNPYETFENTGDKTWPTGYNPKPLISKSIRNLAAAFIDQKFTLRRV